nr:AFG1/ZapE family ATPase [Nitrosomonas nitrosa]
MQRQSCTRATDSFPMIARALASEAALLCFDELQITDIADTLVLTRLFKELFV